MGVKSKKTASKQRWRISVWEFDEKKVLKSCSQTIVGPMTETQLKRTLKFHLRKCGHENYCYEVDKVTDSKA
jgi:hypothetical protein